MIFGLIELYEVDFDERYLQASVDLAKAMIEDFWDKENGGFYFTGKTAETDVPRLKQSYDSAIPSGNSVALMDLLRLSALTGDTSYNTYAEKLLLAFSEDIRGYPMGHTFMLTGLDYLLGPTTNIILVGDLAEKNTIAMLSAIRKQYLPNLTVTLWTDQKSKTAPPGVSYSRIDDKATAYLCQNQTCMPPTNDPTQVLKYLTPPNPDLATHKP